MNNILRTIKSNMTLTQPIEVLENLLIYLYLGNCSSNKFLSLKSGLPIPIISAFKKELIKFDFADNKGTFKLKHEGIKHIKNKLGYESVDINKYNSLSLSEKQKEFESELTTLLETIYHQRPQVNVMLDQAHATLETSIRRVMLLLKNPSIFKQKFLFLGDDDLTSLALMMAFKKLGHHRSQNIFVKDIDQNLLEFIKYVSGQNDFFINTEYIDLKQSNKYAKEFDIILTDPPYTLSGLKLFLSRAISYAKNDNSEILLSFGQKKPVQNREIQRLFHDQNLLIKNIHPQFNHYHGGSIISNVSDLYVLSVTKNTYSTIPENSSYSRKIYTGELNPRMKFYQCKSCHNMMTIGYGKKILTIEKLIETGCNQCHENKFQYRGQEKINLPIQNKIFDTKQLGTHIVIEMKDCDSNKLKSIPIVEEIMLNIARKCDLNIVNHHFHEFKPWGVSGVIILAESHFTIHTWPEYHYAAIDLFICNNFKHKNILMTQLTTQLDSQEYECKILQRGF
ncbi:adenosylmethionine decarboxylase [Xenorhabdus hominickii]|uniref:S-adenosylmethionine decarboxylase proenzyme n=1 Tax=Xenorhabdus hominickii TaxID=351679 RepID=A0A2G0Q5Z3_XENHO|nr:adenosylmethionine decarboxylase [Xenorhabdus hominickii]AOM39580.1 S-adenosylmethionine decarboxylase proenzyme [Xenorhabdus hominickii]PHM54645.1 S-adenosylmethionine decarboxylase proenzyme [Xenorhabdus hominickii]